MPFPIEQKLVLAVSSSAVFDMTEAQRVYDEEGIEAYRTYQRSRLAEPFQKPAKPRCRTTPARCNG